MSIKYIYNKGLTLVELLMALAVVSVILAGSAQNIMDFVLNNRAAAQVNKLQSSLRHARHEAIKRNRSITVCQSADASSCSGNWEDGWIVFMDTNNNDVVDANEQVLQRHAGIEQGTKLAFNQHRVVYAKNGTPRDGSNGSFVFCDSRGAAASIGIVIGPSGRPRPATDLELSGFYRTAETAGLTCS